MIGLLCCCGTLLQVRDCLRLYLQTKRYFQRTHMWRVDLGRPLPNTQQEMSALIQEAEDREAEGKPGQCPAYRG
jgi:hypothetical protein